MKHITCWAAAIVLAVMSGCSNTTETAPTQTLPRVVPEGTRHTLTASEEGTWAPAGKLAGPRLLHTATRLADGRVLVAGGYNRSSELFVPDSGAWSSTGNTLETQTAAAAVLLPTGRVLLAGGGNSGAAAELYNPATGTWSATGALLSPRTYHTLTSLPDGKVLAVGGVDEKRSNKVLATAELYNPATGTWSATGTLGAARRNQTATLLANGKVLVTGGLDTGGTLLTSAELFDPSTGTWSAVAGMSQARASHSATLLADGQVLVVGGEGRNERSSLPAEVFDPATGRWTSGGRLSKPRRSHSATLLSNQRVLVVGGYHEFSGILSAAELYEPSTGTWRSAGSLTAERYSHTATLLADGRVLVAGGNSNTSQSSAELYTSFVKPDPGPPEGSTTVPQGTSLLVHVVDALGASLPNAVVRIKGTDYATDASGYALLENLTAGAFLAHASAPGYSKRTITAVLESGVHAELTAAIRKLPPPIAFNADQDAHIVSGKVQVKIPARSLVDDNGQVVTGMAEIIIDPIDPTTNDIFSAPGPLEGIASADGARVDLESGFMAEISPIQNGRHLQLAPNAKALIIFELPSAFSETTAPGSQIPSWWFDAEAGVWREQGSGIVEESATEPGKLFWKVETSHFTPFNCDRPIVFDSCVDVLVSDQYGNPLPGRLVFALGQGRGLLTGGVSRSNGHACVPAARNLPVWVLLGDRSGGAAPQLVRPQNRATCGSSGCTPVHLTVNIPCGYPGTTQACAYTGPGGTNGVGVCKAGYRVCNGSSWSACTGQVTPAATESCTNAKDDNCNGRINEGCPGSCPVNRTESCYTGPAGTQGVGLCRAGSRTCADGYAGSAVWGACTAQVLPVKEVCKNNLDDDCDGLVDEGCGICNPGETATCYTGPSGTKGVGACRAGVTTCYDGNGGPFYGACVGETLPSGESCDGRDNNCDGKVDEGNPGAGATCTTDRPGICATGTTTCSGGALVCLATTPPAGEVCDGKDNNCDGRVDEGNPGGGTSCATGQPGACASGTTTCSGGALFCSAPTPSAEVCDGKDNDCDGLTDEDNPGAGAACSTGQPGLCASGTTLCRNGGLVCSATTSPSAEVCDGLDNNCDGKVDESNPGGGASCATGKPGVCGTGTTTCTRGALVCSATTAPSAEVCDGLDNDCDGLVDEGNPSGGASCSTGGLGVCGTGTTVCSGGAVTCAATTSPSAEVCDGRDNDCDGLTDEDASDTGAACSTSQPGVCSSGTTVCRNGGLVCSASTSPSAEVCDGQDNDCNGKIDEGNPGGGAYCPTGLPGACSAGVLTCSEGGLLCKAKSQPTAEVCDGVDNDCDGTVDEDCVGGSFPFDFNVQNTSSATRNTEDRLVNLQEGQTLELGTCSLKDAVVKSGDTFVRLIKPSGVALTNDDGCLGGASYLRHTVLPGEAGVYRIKVGCYAEGACSGTAVYSY